MKRLPLAAALLLASPIAARAQAADPEMADFRCMVASSSVDESASAADKEALSMLAIFYLGKIYGRNPAFDAKAYFAAHGKAMDQIDIKVELLRCAKELGDRGAALAALGE